MIVMLSELSTQQREQFIDLYADCFIKDAKRKNRYMEQIKVIFLDAFLQDYAAAYIDGENVAGLVAYSNSKHTAIKFSKTVCQEQLGRLFGSILCKFFKIFFEKPIAKEPDEGYIDFLCVHEDYRRQGLATKLLEFAYTQEKLQHYLLGVMCKNTGAINLYKKQGYKQIRKKSGLIIRMFMRDSVYIMKYTRE